MNGHELIRGQIRTFPAERLGHDKEIYGMKGILEFMIQTVIRLDLRCSPSTRVASQRKIVHIPEGLPQIRGGSNDDGGLHVVVR